MRCDVSVLQSRTTSSRRLTVAAHEVLTGRQHLRTARRESRVTARSRSLPPTRKTASKARHLLVSQQPSFLGIRVWTRGVAVGILHMQIISRICQKDFVKRSIASTQAMYTANEMFLTESRHDFSLRDGRKNRICHACRGPAFPSFSPCAHAIHLHFNLRDPVPRRLLIFEPFRA